MRPRRVVTIVGFVFTGHTGFTCVTDVMGFGIFEDSLGRCDLFRAFCMHRNQNVPFLDLAFVAFGFDFGNSETNQPAGNTTRRRADGRAAWPLV